MNQFLSRTSLLAISVDILLVALAVPIVSLAGQPSDEPQRDVREALATIRRSVATPDDRRAALRIRHCDWRAWNRAIE